MANTTGGVTTGGVTREGGPNDDWIVGSDGDDTLKGHAGKDTLYGGAGEDKLYGGEGDNDYASYRHASEKVVADLFNVVEDPDKPQDSGYLNTRGVSVNPNEGDAEGDSYHGIESLWGSGHDDKLYGNDVANILLGDDGDDKLYGRGGNDTLRGGKGKDKLYGGAGRDSLYGGAGKDELHGDEGDDWIMGDDWSRVDAGADTLYGGAGKDTLWGGPGGDKLYGGEGDNDYASYRHAPAGVVADLFNVVPGESQEDGYLPKPGVTPHKNIGDAAGDLYHGIESLWGSGYDDELYGNDVANILLGDDGDDKLYGRGGNDTLRGGKGKDTLEGGDGRDSLYGGAGKDELHGGEGDDWLVGDDWSRVDSGDDTLKGGAGKDTLYGGAGEDKLYGGEGDNDYASYRHAPAGVVADLFNVVPGESQEDGYRPASDFAPKSNEGDAAGDLYHGIESLWGSAHKDYLYGNDVANILLGDGGDDKLHGRGGNDTLEGGVGDDTLYLGGGSDTVVFGRGDGHDTVAADGFDADSMDEVLFGSGIKSDDLWFKESESGDDLKISVVGEEDSLILKDWFKSSEAGRMDRFRLSSGEVLIESRVHALVAAMGQAAAHGAGPAGLGELPDNEPAYRAFTSALETAWQSPAGG